LLKESNRSKVLFEKDARHIRHSVDYMVPHGVGGKQIGSFFKLWIGVWPTESPALRRPTDSGERRNRKRSSRGSWGCAHHGRSWTETARFRKAAELSDGRLKFFMGGGVLALLQRRKMAEGVRLDVMVLSEMSACSGRGPRRRSLTANGGRRRRRRLAPRGHCARRRGAGGGRGCWCHTRFDKETECISRVRQDQFTHT
jgi:hypothetical protein